MNAGEAYVVYGARGERPLVIDLADPPPRTVIVYGRDPGDAYGEEVYAGDFNGDGWEDLAIGALTGDGISNSAGSAGELALILGGPELPGSRIDLTNPPANTSILFGASAGLIFGDTAFFVDFDEDGKDDLAIGAPRESPGGRANAGTLTIIFGTDAPLPRLIDLGDPPAELETFVVEGNSAGDMLAYSAALAHVNRDGLPDPFINAMGGDGFDDRYPLAGEAYVLDGRRLAQAAGRVVVPTTETATPSATPAASEPTASPTPSRSPVPTASATPVPSSTATASVTATLTPTHVQTPTPSPSPPATVTASPSPSPPPPSPAAAADGCSISAGGGTGGAGPGWLALALLLGCARLKPGSAPTMRS